MLRYALRRFFAAIPLVLGIATIIFFVVHLAPGDPVDLISGPRATEATREQVRANLRLDEPLVVQYGVWMASLARGDLGVSYSYSMPVTRVLASFLPNTLLLSACALLVAFLGGVVLGTIQAVRQHSLTDSAMSVVLLFFYSMPSFWLALMLIITFSLYARNVWDWPFYLPASGVTSTDYDFLGFWGRVGDRLAHLALPTASLALVLTAGIARYMRTSMLEVIRQDYVRTARAKGLPRYLVVYKHALRNALLPIVTLVGLYLPYLFSGTVFIESIFAWPGMGRAIVMAIEQRDYPLIMGATFLFAIMVVLANLLADLLYAVIDPRIRYE